MVWTTVVILPLVLLIPAEARFLPSRDATMTLLQRSAGGFGLIGLWLFWPLIVKERHLSVFWRDLFRSLRYQSSLNPWACLRAGKRLIPPSTRLCDGALRSWQRFYSWILLSPSVGKLSNRLMDV